MDGMIKKWEECGIIDKINEKKNLFIEPRNNKVFMKVFKEYSQFMMNYRISFIILFQS